MMKWTVLLMTAFCVRTLHAGSAKTFWIEPLTMAPNPEAWTQPADTVEEIVTITSDRDNDVSQLGMMLDESGNPAGMQMDTTPASGPATTTQFSLSQIESQQGVVIAQSSGYDAVLLQGTFDGNAAQASLVIQYLSNGLTSDYQTCNAMLSKDSDGLWRLHNAQTAEVVTQIKVITWSLGITTLQGICP